MSHFTIIKGGKQYKDGIDIVPKDIFEYVDKGGELCSTAANNIYDYQEHFKKGLEGYDYLIHINLSSGFSSCYDVATIAAQDFDGKVFVVDSKNLSTGHGHVVCEAVRLVEEGNRTPQEIVDELEDIIPRVDASFVLDRLDYMRKGNRCSTVEYLGANLLKLKPGIEVVDGKMQVFKKYRGSYDKVIVEYVHDKLKDIENIIPDRIFITHTPVSDEIIEIVKKEVESYGYFKEILNTDAGCTISCHCGPSTLGILFIRKK